MRSRSQLRLPLALKVAALACALVALVAGVFAYRSVLVPYRNARAALQSRIARTARDIATSAVRAEGALRLDPAVVALHVRNAHQLGNHIAYTVIFDAEGHADPAVSQVNPVVLREFAPDLAARVGDDLPRVVSLLARGIERPHHGRFTVRLADEAGGALGGLHVGFSLRALDDELSRGLRDNLIVLLAVLLLGAGGAALLGRRVGGRIAWLSGAMAHVRRGDFDVSVAVPGRDEIAELAHSFNEMVVGLRERERLRGTLSRYMSGDVAERILREASDLDVQGERRRVTVVFIDVRHFTTLAEARPPEHVVELLNAYFSLAVEAIARWDGTVHKFIGDSVMALFGAPRDLDRAELRAVLAACDVRDRIARFNRQRRDGGQDVLEIGVGVNTGEAIVGNVGTAERLDYTVIGDDVNLAQRLEDLAREGEILVAEATWEAAGPALHGRTREPVRVKGRAAPVRIWELEAVDPTGLPEDLRARWMEREEPDAAVGT